MSLYLQIENDYKQALKDRKENVVSTLRMFLAALKYEKINKKAELEQTDIIKVLKTEIKKRKESIVEYEKYQRPELAEKEKNELEILQKYMPEQMSEDKIAKIVEQVLAEAGADANIGQVMGKVMAALKGQADGSLVKKIVEQKLQS